MAASGGGSVEGSEAPKQYEEDYVDELFAKIEAEMSAQPPPPEQRYKNGMVMWKGPDDENSYTKKYLNYQREESYVNLDDPFTVHPYNDIRKKIVKKSKKKKKNENTDEDLTTENQGVSEVKGSAADNSDSDEDFLDAYGNIKPKQAKELVSEKDEDSKEKVKGRGKERVERGSWRGRGSGIGRGADRGGRGRGNPMWRDLDSVDEAGLKSPEPSKGSEKDLKVGQTKIMFPKHSSLNRAEHKKFLQLSSKSQLNDQDYELYNNLLSFVVTEQEEFNKFAQEIAQDRESYNHLSLEFVRYLNEYRGYRLKRPIAYPRWWIQQQNLIRLTPAAAPGNQESGNLPKYSFNFEAKLLELGVIPKATVPDVKFRRGRGGLRTTRLPNKYERLVFRVPTDPGLAPGCQGASRGEERSMRAAGRNERPKEREAGADRLDGGDYVHKVPVSADPNCEKLAQFCVPQIIISASALNCLMDNHAPTFDRCWEMSVIVRTYASATDSKTVVFVDKPFPSKLLNVIEKNEAAHKVAAEVLLFHEWSQSQVRTKDVEASAGEKVEEDDFFGDGANVQLDDLETFGTEKDEVSVANLFRVKASKKKKEESGKLQVDKNETPISQLDGAATESDSDDNLVIAEPEDPVVDQKNKIQDSSQNVENDDAKKTPTTSRRKSSRAAVKKDPQPASIRVTRRSSRSSEKGDFAAPELSLKLSPESDISSGKAERNNPEKNTDVGKTNENVVEKKKRGRPKQTKSKIVETSQQVKSVGVGSEIAKIMKQDPNESEDEVGSKGEEILLHTEIKNEAFNKQQTNDVIQEKKNDCTNVNTTPQDKASEQIEDTDNCDKAKPIDIFLHDLNPTDSESSSEELDAESIDQIKAKKLAAASQLSTPQSSSDSDSDEDVKAALAAKKKLIAQKINDGSSSGSESDDDDNQIFASQHVVDLIDLIDLDQKKKEDNIKGPNSEKECEPTEGETGEKKVLTKQVSRNDLFGSDVESSSDDDIGKKKVLRKIRSSGSEEEEENERKLKEKLESIGKEKADPEKVKRNVKINERLKLLSTRKQDVISVQKKKRKERAKKRTENEPDKDAESEPEPIKESGIEDLVSTSTNETSSTANPSKTAPVSSDSKKAQKRNSVEEPGATKKAKVDDSESEDDRFNKFTSEKEKVAKKKTNLLDNLLSNVKELHEKKKIEKPKRETGQEYKGETLNFVASEFGEATQFKSPAPGRNVTYNMWNIFDKEAPQKTNMKVIVRSKVHGVRQSDSVLISPRVKLEYQPDFGAEIVSKSALSREWISALIRPGSLATRLRVDATTSEVCMIEQKTLTEVSQEGFSKGLDFSIQLGNLYNIFNGLKDLAAGQYLLQHDEKSGPFCRLLKAKEGGGASTGAQYALPPYIPKKPFAKNLLDPSVIKFGKCYANTL